MTALTLALDLYDRHMPLFLGSVPGPNGLDYRALEVGMVPPRRHGIDRHGRMLRDREFDAAEVSLASFIMAKRRGSDLIGVPVFPRRLFSQNHIFVNPRSGIRSPADLRGKRIGLWAFQVTMSVLAKGDLQSFYGVPWRDIGWITQYPEEVPWTGTGLAIERAPHGRDLADMLIAGEIDAFIHPHPPHSIQQHAVRLFADSPGECARYAAARGYLPIMHLIAVKPERLRERPALAHELIELFESAKRAAYEYYHDPGYAVIANARSALEWEQAHIALDAWPAGLAANRANLETFIGYMVDQQLVDAPVAVDSLFDASVIGA